MTRFDRLQDPAPGVTFTGDRQRSRTQVRKSSVHGRGVFATRAIPAGDTIFEYVGEVITWEEALRRHPHDPADPHHTFYFHIDDGHVIDGKHKGNSSRWINHSCAPNCEADQADDGRVFVKALRDLEPGEELCYDYGLIIDERYTPALKKQFACHCGASACRGTMLAPKRRKAPEPAPKTQQAAQRKARSRRAKS